MNKYVIFAFLSAVFIGISTVFASEAARTVEPLIVASLTALISSIIIFSFLKLSRNKIQIISSVKRFPKEIFSIVLFRILLGNVLLIYGLRLTNAMKAGFMLRIEPLFVLILASLFLRQKIKLKDVSLTIVLLIGAFLLSTSGNVSLFTSSQVGDILIILATLFFSYTYIPAKELSNSIKPLAANVITNLIGGSILLVVALLMFPVSSFLLSNYALLMIAGYIVTFYFIGLTLWYDSLRKVRGWIVSYILSISALTTAIVAYFWLGQILTFIQIIGAIIILISSIYISKSR